MDGGGGGSQPLEAMHSGSSQDSLGTLGHWHDMKEEAREDLAELWETQWQEFLSTVEICPSGPGVPEEPTPWGDALAFLASFEQVAEACQWPKEEWVARLLPALRGEAKQAFSRLEARDREDYGKVKAVILQGDTLGREKNRQHFRSFCYQEAKGPRVAYSQLQELCHRWLKVERHSKEEILELLILEQFLAVLPPEMQNWIKGHNLESSAQAVSLAEDFMIRHWMPEGREEQVAVLQGEGSMNLQEVARESSEEDTNLDLGKVHEDGKENHLPESSKQTDSQGMSPKSANDNGSWYCNQEETSENWHEAERQQIIYPREDGQKSVLCEEVGIKPNVTVLCQRTNKGKRRNACSVCGKTFTRNSSLIQHKITHTREKLYRCSHCGKRFICSAYLKKHMISHSAEKPHKCLQCGKSFHDKTSLKRHQKIHTGERSFKSPDCGESFMSSTYLDIHTREKSPPVLPEAAVYICCECGESFERASDLNVHQRIHKEKPFKCPDCGENFMWISSWKRHRKLHEENSDPTHTGEKKCICSDCGKGFYELWKLRRHQRIHTGEKPYKCTDCGECFMWSLSLDAHIKKIHQKKIFVPLPQKVSGRQGKSFRCAKCGEKFTRASHLIRHQHIHTREKPYKCTSCEKCFMHCSSLERHRRIHERETPGPLVQNASGMQEEFSACGEKFRTSHLTRHQNIHIGEKPYQCTNCGECFMQSSSLDSHRKMIHQGTKLVPLLQKVTSVQGKSSRCCECGEKFSRASHLIRHQRIHTGEKPYKCPECGECFMWSSSLDSHRKKIHQEKKLIPVPQKVPGNPEKSSSCSECGKKFKKVSQLTNHQRIHTGEKPYQCSVCGQCFAWSSSLSRHKKIHRRKKSVSLLQKVSSRQGESPTCTECGKKFNRASHLIRHQHIHTRKSRNVCS
ncbi:zinc finger protein 665-like isoform X2 [Rhineura floridana]|uniref:zinc finger protein 665-like isoform X2 n=1 Tax=Rhineura floridana TaxID=261503 RepID=UPI002AC891ED|nr:zinc finger protein 665-like isoform X2 [Rhineura floridana]